MSFDTSEDSTSRFDYTWAFDRLGIFNRYLGEVKQGIHYHQVSLEIFSEIGDHN